MKVYRAKSLTVTMPAYTSSSGTYARSAGYVFSEKKHLLGRDEGGGFIDQGRRETPGLYTW